MKLSKISSKGVTQLEVFRGFVFERLLGLIGFMYWAFNQALG